ncbi:MAG: UDP-N-acetylmuramate dehydrogenase [candidate division WOR-3 bacterium]
MAGASQDVIFEELKQELMGQKVTIKENELLAEHTSFRIGGPARLWVEAGDEAAVERVVRFCFRRRMVLWVLGAGTNVLVSDQGLRGVVLKLTGRLAEVRFDGTAVHAGAGARLDDIVDGAERAGLAGAEFLAGIPGTVGGGLRTNAGAFGRSLSDILESVTALDRKGNRITIGREGLRSEYRKAVIDESQIALAVVLRLEPGKPKPAAELRRQRWGKHPNEASAGSFFKNPKEEPAGSLIERCGLKGRTVGKARVSERHANFIVNMGNARFSDVLELSQLVKATVEERTGIVLEEEVQILPGPVGDGLSPDVSDRR